MNEIIFWVVDAPEGGYTARALGQSIFTEADTVDELRRRIREAVDCHFEDDNRPAIIRSATHQFTDRQEYGRLERRAWA